MKILFLIFIIANSVLFAHGISESDIQLMLNGSNFQYIWLGATHMLTGYDHLLFLFGVLFFLTTFKDIVKFVTVFTLGHSITLIFATFMGINASYYLVDAVIAISVIYKAFDNNGYFQSYFKISSPNLMLMVFLFGLIHGFGLSTRLQQLPLGNQDMDMFLRIVSFNIGVEFGQIVALVLMLIILVQLRKLASFKHFAKIINDIIILLGVLLFLMQMHGYLHQAYEEDFGFNHDEHYHIHQEMRELESSKYKHDSL